MAKPAKSTRRSGRGTTILIVTLLVASALLRIGAGPGEALAQAGTSGEEPALAAESQAESSVAPDALNRGEMSALLAALRARETRLKVREAQIDMRSRALEVADAEISKRLETLEQAEANLRQTLALADGAAEDDLARLTTVYENMKPKDAAALFATMEPDFAAGFMGRMRPDAAAAVMAGLPPDVAYSISVILAGRNANAPKS